VLPRAAMAGLSANDFSMLQRGRFAEFAMSAGPYQKAPYGAKGGPFGLPIPGPGGLISITTPTSAAVEAIKALRKVIAELARPAVEAAMGVGEKFLEAVPPMARKIPLGVMRKMGSGVLEWISGVDAKAAEEEAKMGDLRRWAPQDGSMPYMGLINYLSSTGTPFAVSSTYRPGDGGSYHALGRAADFVAATGPSIDSAELGAIYRAFLPIESQLAELIYAGPQASYNIKNGQRVAKYAQEQHHNHVHAALAAGGLIRARAGGMLARLGEGGRDEAVVPLPRNFDPDRLGERTYHFHGDLSFPNISDPNDAGAFIRNLEALVSD
jgi:hypothetical protein